MHESERHNDMWNERQQTHIRLCFARNLRGVNDIHHFGIMAVHLSCSSLVLNFSSLATELKTKNGSRWKHESFSSGLARVHSQLIPEMANRCVTIRVFVEGRVLVSLVLSPRGSDKYTKFEAAAHTPLLNSNMKE